MNKEEKEIQDFCRENSKIIEGYLSPYENSPYFRDMNKIMLRNALIGTRAKKWYLNGAGWFKCDAPECDFLSKEIPSIPMEHYYLFNNLPCPKCGADIFTDKDYAVVLGLNTLMSFKIVRFLNWFGKKFGLLRKYSIKMDGTGKLDIKAE